MSRIWAVAIMAVIFLGVLFQDAQAQDRRLEIGGRSIVLVDGKVPDSLAKEMIDYSRNLYERADYSQTRSNLSRIISAYDGDSLADAYFLRAKANFMSNRFNDSFQDFLTVFDRFRSSPPVRNGEIESTLSKALDAIVKEANLLGDKCCQNIEYGKLGNMMKFYELYKYVTGRPSMDKIEKVLATKITRRNTLTNPNRDGNSAGVGSKYHMDIGGGSWTPVLLGAVITDAALKEWRYMKLVREVSTIRYSESHNASVYYFNYKNFGPMLDLGGTVEVSMNGEELQDYKALLPKLRGKGIKQFAVRLKGSEDVVFSVRGPSNWSYKNLDPGEFGGITWEDGSYMGPVEVDFVLRDMIMVHYGSVGDWVGLNRVKEQL